MFSLDGRLRDDRYGGVLLVGIVVLIGIAAFLIAYLYFGSGDPTSSSRMDAVPQTGSESGLDVIVDPARHVVCYERKWYALSCVKE